MRWTMKKLFSLFFAISLILSACGTVSTTPAQTGMPIVTHTATQTVTSTITPLPTFTPTFDVSTIVTVTPAEKAECPTSIPYPEKDFDLFEFWENGNYQSPEEAALALLNKYGSEVLVNYERSFGDSPETMAFQDFTNDGVPELAIRLTLNTSFSSFDIFGCQDGEYHLLLSIPSNGLGYAPIIVSIEDNNKNSVPELTILEGYLSQGGHSFGVYEWDGEKFTSLLPPNHPDQPDSTFLWVEATGKIYYKDVDSDFLNELILESGIPVWEIYYVGLPWRNNSTYYKWNGQVFAPYKSEFTEPEFRFQAVQDADLAFTQQEYGKAVVLYQEAIFSDELRSYSPEIRENLRAIWEAQYGEVPTPTPYPIEDPTEYPSLAAYAYYRIMLLHLVQGQEAEAESTYQTLQDTFGADPYAASYVEMATKFWEAYQSTNKMYDGCAAAIQYAVEHPQILTPLGSDYHGWQSHIYVPADVCPFR